MKENKYRFWDIKNKEMVYDLTLKVGVYNIKVCEYFGHKPMQYIGLKDIKRTEEYPQGQEIYEGDVIKYQIYELGEDGLDGSYVYKTDVVTLDNLRYWLKNERFGYEGEGLIDVNYNECEVIGNIYENPELTEV